MSIIGTVRESITGKIYYILTKSGTPSDFQFTYTDPYTDKSKLQL